MLQHQHKPLQGGLCSGESDTARRDLVYITNVTRPGLHRTVYSHLRKFETSCSKGSKSCCVVLSGPWPQNAKRHHWSMSFSSWKS